MGGMGRPIQPKKALHIANPGAKRKVFSDMVQDGGKVKHVCTKCGNIFLTANLAASVVVKCSKCGATVSSPRKR